MVESDIGDDGEHREDDIGAIESAAQTYFDDGEIHFLVGEVLKGHRRHYLEERRGEGFEESLLLFHEVDDVIFINGLAIDTDTL